MLAARAEFQAGPHVIGWATGIAASTVHAILRRHGCSRLKPRLPRGEIIRYQRERAGELVHVDCKKLGRIIVPGHRVTGDRSRRAPRGRAGWQYLFVAIDDATRLGYAASIRTRPPTPRSASSPPVIASTDVTGSVSSASSQTTAPASKALARACDQLAIGVRRPGLTGRRQTARRSASSARCSSAGPTPQPYTTERERAQALPDAIDTYNRNRPHRALGGRTPLQRVNDLSGTNT